MSSSGEDFKSIRILPFDDKVKDFRKWHLKFKAAAELKGYADVLVGKETVPIDSEDLDISTDEGKEKMKARKANQRAYTDLILACHGDLSFKVVANAVTNDLSNGDACLAWKNLKNQFLPRTSANKSVLVTKFWKSRLKSLKKDPEIWINDLEVMRERLDDLGYDIKEEALMIHILNHLPAEYDVAVHHLLKRMDNLSDPLEMSEIKGDLRLIFMTLKSRSKSKKYDDSDEDSDDSDDEESAFVAGGKFKGRCYKCGRFGHKSVNCPNSHGTQNSKNGQKFNGKCFYCGKWGHRKSECRKLLEDRKGNENANVVHQESDEGEIAFIVEQKTKKKVTFDKKTVHIRSDGGDFDILTNDTWLIDSGASSHISNTTEGLIHLRKIEKR